MREGAGTRKTATPWRASSNSVRSRLLFACKYQIKGNQRIGRETSK